jgi:hypothetical protein
LGAEGGAERTLQKEIGVMVRLSTVFVSGHNYLAVTASQSGCVSLEDLWDDHSKKAKLSDVDLRHVWKCNECLSRLGLYQLCYSLEEVERRKGRSS